MNEFIVPLEVENPDEPPRVDVHDEWRQFALWLSGRYGLLNVDWAELPAEWIVTTNDPTTRAKVVLPLRELPPGLTNNLS